LIEIAPPRQLNRWMSYDCIGEMRFQHLTRLDLSEQHMHVAYSTDERPSRHWTDRVDKKHESHPNRIVEQTFEKVRLGEFAKLPSRRHCLFMFDFGLDPDFYADSMNFLPPESFNVVEIEVGDAVSNFFRADKSLVTTRIVDENLPPKSMMLRQTLESTGQVTPSPT
jgi:hypothetical protein